MSALQSDPHAVARAGGATGLAHAAAVMLALAGLALLAACRASEMTHPNQPDSSRRAPARIDRTILECQVTSVAIDSIDSQPGVSAIALQDSTFVEPTIVQDSVRRIDSGFVLDPRIRRILGDSVTLQSSTIDDFVRVNVTRSPRCPTMTARVPLFAFHAREFESVQIGTSRALDWGSFHRLHPHGTIVTVSRVGFSSNGRQALLTTSTYCGGLCGGGYLVLLEQDPDGRWTVRAAVMLWVS